MIASGTVFGPYRVIEKIGAGGMGDVYRALDTRLEREVALKLISDSFLAAEPGAGSPSPAGTPHSRVHLSHERFLREARAAATLNHPNICAIHDVGEQDGQPYLVMELLRGETLKQYLTHQKLSPAELLTLGQQAASALAAAHARGIVHRDIKPANLFVVESGRDRKQLKILDFGLAKKQGVEASPDSRYFDTKSDSATATGMMDLTTPGSTVGTAAYMSPEQAKGDPLDARTDLFSLGSVLFEMATGQAPFGGHSTAEVFAALLMKEPPPVSSLNPAMPKALDPVIAKLLAKERDQRYRGAEELLADLEAVSGSSSSSNGTASTATAAPIPPASAVPPLPDSDRRRPRNRLIAVGALVLVAGAGAAFMFRDHPGAKPAPESSAVVAPGGAPAAKPTSSKDSIIVADFINKTGDAVFDTTLNQALRVQLAQSPVLDIISQQHLRQSLQFLGRKQDETITPQIAREIGEREGVKAILTGSIAPLGKAFVLTLDAQNTANGDDIASAEATAPDKEHVLEALNQVTATMRGKLGESLSSIQRLNAPFGQATTPSLEAFRAYALGDEAHQKGNDIPEAYDHYKRALELDPKLAMAWARLGVLKLNTGAITEAAQNFTRAYQLSDNVSEREKLYIAGHYYSTVVGNQNKSIETLQVATQEYPLDASNFINLGVSYAAIGELEKSEAANRGALALQPENAIALENEVGGAAQLGLPAEKYISEGQRLGLNGTSLFLIEAGYYAAHSDLDSVHKILAETAGRPDQFSVLAWWGGFLPQLGQFELARTTLLSAAEQAASAKEEDAQAGALLNVAYAGWMVDRCSDPDKTVKDALKLDKGKVTVIYAAMTLALCNQEKHANQMLSDLEKHYLEDTLVQGLYVPQSRGWLALKAGDPQRALALLERVRAHDNVSFAPYIRGLAYLQLKDPRNAIASFEDATRRKGVAYNVGSPYALSYLGLGRAYAMAGDKPNARKAYDVFFNEWKNADSDLPVMAEAKKEYAQL
jgi:serine/threonine protein kinase/tetratricopeptide (TPR) repeat protein